MQAGHSVLVTGFTARLPARLDPPRDGLANVSTETGL